jgi:hypothetical protein
MDRCKGISGPIEGACLARNVMTKGKVLTIFALSLQKD